MSEHNQPAAGPAPGGIRARITRVVEWAMSTKPVRAFLLYTEEHGPALADSITYRTLFSVFAGVYLGFAVAGIWLSGNREAIDALVETVGTVIPGLVGEGGVIDPDDIVQPFTLSITGALALVGLLGAAIGAISSLDVALRELTGRPDPGRFFLWTLLRNLAIAVAFGLLLAVAALITVLGTGALGTALAWLGLPVGDAFLETGSRALSILVTFVIDTVVIAGLFRILSGLRPRARTLWGGALIGGAGLTVLQVLSGLFVGGATSNPLLASFGSLIALLIWLNLSSQVVLLASAYIVTGVDDETDRVAARYGATSPALRRLRRAERRAADVAAEVAAARDALPNVHDPGAHARQRRS
jgi:membrane protein